MKLYLFLFTLCSLFVLQCVAGDGSLLYLRGIFHTYQVDITTNETRVVADNYNNLFEIYQIIVDKAGDYAYGHMRTSIAKIGLKELGIERLPPLSNGFSYDDEIDIMYYGTDDGVYAQDLSSGEESYLGNITFGSNFVLHDGYYMVLGPSGYVEKYAINGTMIDRAYKFGYGWYKFDIKSDVFYYQGSSGNMQVYNFTSGSKHVLDLHPTYSSIIGQKLMMDLDIDTHLVYVLTTSTKFYVFDLSDSSYILEQDLSAWSSLLDYAFGFFYCKGVYAKSLNRIYIMDGQSLCYFTPTDISTITCVFNKEFSGSTTQGITGYGDHIYYYGDYASKGTSGIFHAPVGTSNLNLGNLVATGTGYTNFTFNEEGISTDMDYSEFTSRLLQFKVYIGNDYFEESEYVFRVSNGTSEVVYQNIYYSRLTCDNGSLYFSTNYGTVRANFDSSPVFSTIYERSTPEYSTLTQFAEGYNTAWSQGHNYLNSYNLTTGIETSVVTGFTWALYIGDNQYIVQGADLQQCTTTGCTLISTGSLFSGQTFSYNVIYVKGLHEIWKTDSETSKIYRYDIDTNSILLQNGTDCPCCSTNFYNMKAYQLNDTNYVYFQSENEAYVVVKIDLRSLNDSNACTTVASGNIGLNGCMDNKYVYRYNADANTVEVDIWVENRTVTVDLPYLVSAKPLYIKDNTLYLSGRDNTGNHLFTYDPINAPQTDDVLGTFGSPFVKVRDIEPCLYSSRTFVRDLNRMYYICNTDAGLPGKVCYSDIDNWDIVECVYETDSIYITELAVASEFEIVIYESSNTGAESEVDHVSTEEEETYESTMEEISSSNTVYAILVVFAMVLAF